MIDLNQFGAATSKATCEGTGQSCKWSQRGSLSTELKFFPLISATVTMIVAELLLGPELRVKTSGSFLRVGFVGEPN
jgi:hypothetical protein